MADEVVGFELGADVPEGYRSGFIAVAGRPNAGKSTLINHLVGEHVAIVSPIAQTTRRVVRAVRTTNESQIVFVDLPGSQQPVDRLTSRMQTSVEHSLGDVDAVVWVLDARQQPKAGEYAVARLVFDAGVPVIIAMNKVDKVKPVQLAERIQQVADLVGMRDFQALIPISAISGEACDDLLREIEGLLPVGPPFYGPGDVTDMRESERISEYVREATLQHLKEELPHATIVEVEEVAEDEETGLLRVTCIIWVERESQVGIVVGKKGAMIRQIGTDARPVVESVLGRSVYLDLRVKVRSKWRDDDAQLTRWGL